ncbi:ion transporter [Planctomycetales bacterium]|nr:ion transporter [Planctomycetales bacterium]
MTHKPTLNLPYELFMLLVCLMALGVLFVDATVAAHSEIKTFLTWIDYALSGLFFVDFIYQLATTENRRKYLCTWGIVDLISCVPAFGWGRIFRVLRIVKLLRLIIYANTLFKQLNKQRAQSALWTVFLLLVVATMFGSVAILQFELHGGIINNAGDALWWTLCMTLKGECDGFDSPVTLEGRCVSIALLIVGNVIQAGVIGFVASLLMLPEEYRE